MRWSLFVNRSVACPVPLVCALIGNVWLNKIVSRLVLFVSFPQPRPWGTDTVNPPSLQSAVLRERRVLRPWCPSALTRRASRASTSSKACSPTSPPCQSARSASSWLSRWWVGRDGLKGYCSLCPAVIGCCCSVSLFKDVWRLLCGLLQKLRQI